MSDSEKIKIGISIGDVNGIGIEVLLKTLIDNRILDLCTPILYGSSKITSFHRKLLNIQDFSFNIINDVAQANPKRANLVNCWQEDVKIDIGQSTEIAGKYAYLSLEKAVDDLNNKKIHALVTLPINKHNISQAGFQFAGHTEYLQSKANAKDSLMLLISDHLKIGVVTGHIPVKDIANSITQEKIISKLNILHDSLRSDFRIQKPKIAVLALNPHAGDKGVIGHEEEKTIIPAIEKANHKNIFVFGPYAADGFFGNGTYKQFDAVLAMYHDQGLIPFKSLAFEDGVNYTAGLPFIRTSPDHGTGYDIAGKNLASESSFRKAIYSACDIYRCRTEYEEITANPLKIHKLSKERGENS
jgi:4-hydroxythreonine-4-phosphate dehydrogenase